MPRTTVYIRDADWDKWKLITNKAELISQAINRSVIQPIQTKRGIKTIQTVESPPPVPKTAQEVAEQVKQIFPDAKPITKPPVTYKNTNSWGA